MKKKNEPRQEVVDAVIEDLKCDFVGNDFTVLEELLFYVPEKYLIGSLREEIIRNPELINATDKKEKIEKKRNKVINKILNIWEKTDFDNESYLNSLANSDIENIAVTMCVKKWNIDSD